MKIVRSNPSGKRTKVNDLMKRLEFLLSYDKDLNDPLAADYVKGVLDTTIAAMKDEGILTMPENWVLYTLHCIVFNNLMFRLTDKIYTTYNDIAEKHELDNLIAIQEPDNANHAKSCIKFCLDGDLTPFMWMILDNEGNITENTSHTDSLHHFVADFKEEMTRLAQKTDFAKIIGLTRRYYTFFKEDLENAMNTIEQGRSMTYEPMNKVMNYVFAQDMEKKMVTQVAHFWGQANVLDIAKIKKHPMLPLSNKPATTFHKLMSYFRQVEQKFLIELEKERGNKFVPKNFLDWGNAEESTEHPLVVLSWKTTRGYIYWESLGKPYSFKEGQWALHCGNSTRQGSRDNIFSLREQVGEKVKILITLTAERRKDGTYFLRESKGVGNNKPDPKYWDYIVDLFLYYDNFHNRNLFSDLTGGGYWTENNLNFPDLTEKQRNRIIEQRPDLVSGTYYALYMRDAFKGLQHIVDNYKSSLLSKERASDQIIDLLSLFFYPDDKNTVMLKFNFFSRRRYDDVGGHEEHDEYIKNALKTLTVKSINSAMIVKTVPLELFDDGSMYQMDAETVGVIFGSMDEAVRKLMGDKGNKLIERMISTTRISWHKYPRKHELNLIRTVLKNEVIRMIDKGVEFNLKPISEKMINYLNEFAPHLLPDHVLERLPFYDYLSTYAQKYDLVKKKQTEDAEIDRHQHVSRSISAWVQHHSSSYDAVGSISQEDAKKALKKFPFLKENMGLQVIADGDTKKVVNKLLNEFEIVKGERKQLYSLAEDKEGLVFSESDGLEDIYDILGNDDQVEHLFAIYKDGHYDIGDIGMRDKDLKNEISGFSGYVYKHEPEIYKKLSYWFEEMDDESPEWDTEDGEKMLQSLRDAYFAGYESGAYDDCIKSLEEYLENQLKHSVNFNVEHDRGTWKISVNIIRLKKLLFDYWMDRTEYSALHRYLGSLVVEEKENPTFRGRDIDTFSWDSALERFLDSIRENFGDRK